MIPQLASGVRILAEWIGEGAQPVLPAHAQARADICLACPRNVQGHWWSAAKSELANAIRAHLEVKTELQLRVFGEEKLGTCSVCQCNLPLKVHVPAVHLRNHTSPNQLTQFPAHCWIPKELS